MLTITHIEQDSFRQTVLEGAPEALPKRAVWIDLHDPTQEEEAATERLLDIGIPTRDEMQEIETSSRLYDEDGAVVMILPVLNKSSSDEPEIRAVAFMIAQDRLITLRYCDPHPFAGFATRLARLRPNAATTGVQMAIGLWEQIVDRLADIAETAAASLENQSRSVFAHNDDPRSDVDFKEVLRHIGRIGNLAAQIKDSVLNLNRLVSFFGAQIDLHKEDKARLKTLMQDAGSIDEHATFLSSKSNFLLDATLGMINIEQNNIIKIFSVAAVAFLPPTLIASIYGMNFEGMPELKWAHGYPFAIFMMVISAVLPFLYFKRKKWL